MDKDLQEYLDMLKENKEEIRNDAETALSSICQQILSHPNDKQYRTVRLDDPLVTKKLLPAVGAMECLFDIGFVEATDCLFLPEETPLTKLRILQGLLNKNSTKVHMIKNAVINELLPITCTKKERQFFIEIIKRFQQVLQYEDVSLQEKARKVIPIVELEIATMTRIRELQKRIKLDKTYSGENSKKQYSESVMEDIKDLFLMELMHWFKYKFFTWVTTPKCTTCFSECKYKETMLSKDPKCSRIEIHKCTNCEMLVEFPRYSDPEPLLTLRRGRCGEWATVFTLLCRTLGYDARLVHDQTDHIWTEVWSIHEKRWIHVDPCEDIMDRPLMYEKGWKKKLTYIIACSKDEVQDVTWRYTRDQSGVMERRKLCSETKLLQFIESLNRHQQFSANYGASRRAYVLKRRLFELVELIHMPKQQQDSDDNYQERTTGSYEWKLARGEVSERSSKPNYFWDISKYGNTFHLHYFIVEDTYKVTDNDGLVLEQMSGWENGLNETQGKPFRKVENDWNMVYLARSPKTTCGKVKWNFVVRNPKLCVETFNLQATITVFHGANVTWEVEAFFDETDQNKSIIFPIDDCTNYHTEQVKGSIKLILTGTLSGGEGDCAWQHAQLFRQSLENKEDRSLLIDIQLKNR